MAKYALIYSGGMGMEADPEDQQRIMEEWGAWYAKLGPAVVDGGAPFADAKHLTGNGVESVALDVFHLELKKKAVELSLDAAAATCEDHPHLRHGGQVQVFTCIDMSPPE